MHNSPMAGRFATVSEVRAIELPRYARADGAVVVAERVSHVPFAIARLFTLRAPVGSVRGKHAHRRGRQFILCASGVVDVDVDDGMHRRTMRLGRDNQALHVPAMIWNAVSFHAPESVLVVLCDQPFAEDDYIRDYATFLDARRTTGA
ncbi:MAG: WxcM-like domain-containing protein [Proteobacteria bacterium]|nr:WxcM-like domain-containing protein [Pseudomonadota bacterium]